MSSKQVIFLLCVLLASNIAQVGLTFMNVWTDQIIIKTVNDLREVCRVQVLVEK